jgi:cell wall-associated NlpC family hydrolase
MPGFTNPIVFGTLAGSLALTQPFSAYLDVDVQKQNEILTNSETLTYGTHSDAVSVLKKKLKNLEMFSGETDNHYDVVTEHYVKQFQRRYSLNVTGRANKETIYKLIEVEKEFYLEPLTSLENEKIDIGMYSEDVKKIQNALRYFGYYDGEIDGIYGPLTKAAAKSFQEDHKIPVRDELDKQFIELLQTNQTSNQNAVVHTVQTVETQDNVKETAPLSSSSLIATAKSYLGTPYVWGGESPSGFDCSGYLQYIFGIEGYSIPRTVTGIWSATSPVNKPSVGDIVFFETYKPGPSHAGIYLGNGTFIHAGNNGVTISEMSLSYWDQRYLGARRVAK